MPSDGYMQSQARVWSYSGHRTFDLEEPAVVPREIQGPESVVFLVFLTDRSEVRNESTIALSFIR